MFAEISKIFLTAFFIVGCVPNLEAQIFDLNFKRIRSDRMHDDLMAENNSRTSAWAGFWSPPPKNVSDDEKNTSITLALDPLTSIAHDGGGNMATATTGKHDFEATIDLNIGNIANEVAMRHSTGNELTILAEVTPPEFELGWLWAEASVDGEADCEYKFELIGDEVDQDVLMEARFRLELDEDEFDNVTNGFFYTRIGTSFISAVFLGNGWFVMGVIDQHDYNGNSAAPHVYAYIDPNPSLVFDDVGTILKKHGDTIAVEKITRYGLKVVATNDEGGPTLDFDWPDVLNRLEIRGTTGE